MVISWTVDVLEHKCSFLWSVGIQPTLVEVEEKLFCCYPQNFRTLEMEDLWKLNSIISIFRENPKTQRFG